MPHAADANEIKHLAVVNIAAWSHVRSITCFVASLLLHEPLLHVSFFVPEPEGKKAQALLKHYDLGGASKRLRMVHLDVSLPENANPSKEMKGHQGAMGGAAANFIDQYYEKLVAGHAIDGHEALPCPTAIMADNFAHPVTTYARQQGYAGETMLWLSTDPGAITYFDSCSRQALVSTSNSVLWAPKGLTPRWTHEYGAITTKMSLPRGEQPDNMLQMYQGRMGDHRQIVGFSRQLLPDGVEELANDTRLRRAKRAVVVGAMYPPWYWSSNAPVFPAGDPLFKWLGRQNDHNVILVSFGSAFFPNLDLSWQLETLIDALIRNKWRYVLLFGAAGVKGADEAILDRAKQKTEASGNLHHGWCDQELVLRHPSIAFCLNHCGAGVILETLIVGVPTIAWPFTADQPLNASRLTDKLDCAFELWQVRDRLAGGVEIASKPDLAIQATPEALADELDNVLQLAKGETGQRKRANAQKAQALLREENEQRAKQYLDDFLSLLAHNLLLDLGGHSYEAALAVSSVNTCLALQILTRCRLWPAVALQDLSDVGKILARHRWEGRSAFTDVLDGTPTYLSCIERPYEAPRSSALRPSARVFLAAPNAWGRPKNSRLMDTSTVSVFSFWLYPLLPAALALALIFAPYIYDRYGLRRYPGPFLAALSPFYLWRESRRGRRWAAVHDWHAKYGTYVRISPNHLSIADPDAIPVIYSTNTIKADFYDAFVSLERGLFNVRDPKQHARKRKIVSHAFSASSVKSMEPIVAEFVDRLLGKWDQHCAEAAKTDSAWACNTIFWHNALAFDVIGSLSFGAPFDMIERESDMVMVEHEDGSTSLLPAIKVLGERGEYSSAQGVLPPWLRPYMAKIDKTTARGLASVQHLSGIARHCVNLRLQEGSGRKDLLAYIQAGRDDKGEPLGKTELVAEALTQLIAGSDTVATSSTMILFFLAKHRKVQQKLVAELQEALGTGFEGVVANDQVKSLPYLNACINEAFRIHSTSSFGLHREVVSPIEFKGHHLQVGQVCSVPSYVIHHLPSIWGDPENYRPERWLEDNAAELEKCFIPFSHGPRACIGRNLAQLELAVFTASVVWRYDLILRDDTPPPIHEGFIKKPRESWLLVKRRQ